MTPDWINAGLVAASMLWYGSAHMTCSSAAPSSGHPHPHLPKGKITHLHQPQRACRNSLPAGSSPARSIPHSPQAAAPPAPSYLTPHRQQPRPLVRHSSCKRNEMRVQAHRQNQQPHAAIRQRHWEVAVEARQRRATVAVLQGVEPGLRKRAARKQARRTNHVAEVWAASRCGFMELSLEPGLPNKQHAAMCDSAG
eukprot:349873-Chlamydomonas_euryale.AAC.3